MMISDKAPDRCFVWIWLPGQTAPVVAGRIDIQEGRYLFTYGRSYLANPQAIPIDPEALPLRSGTMVKDYGTDALHGAIRDSMPDAWGRRVILNILTGIHGRGADTATLDELTYMLESGSDRIGALDFQASASHYIPRTNTSVDLAELQHSAELVEKGIPLTNDLAQVLNHGTSIGGARPKVLIDSGDKKYIAKFSSSTDQYNVIKAEYIAMKLAGVCGLDVAPVQLERVSGRDVLLIERFDRIRVEDGWCRRAMLSALTLLNLDEMTSRYASYEDFAEIIRHRFANPGKTLNELFGRMVFNILIGNTDDHARNHAAFWDGKSLELTPAYDLCPQLRHGGEASQAMFITGQDNTSRLTTCVRAAGAFMVSTGEAESVIDRQVSCIRQNLDPICHQANLSPVEKETMLRYMLLQPSVFQGYNAH